MAFSRFHTGPCKPKMISSGRLAEVMKGIEVNPTQIEQVLWDMATYSDRRIPENIQVHPAKI